MFRRWRGFQIFGILAFLLFMSFGLTKPEMRPDEEDMSVSSTQGDVKEYQAKLDMIDPDAYTDLSDLKLESGDYISIIGKTSSTEFFKEVKAGVVQAGKDLNEALGFSGNNKVKVSFHAPSSYENVDDQVNLLDEELAIYPVAIGISIVDQEACDVQFDLAKENGIPIVAYDSGNDYKGIDAMIGTDNTAAGKECAKNMAEAIDQKGKIIVLRHDSYSETADKRVHGFKKELKENYKDVKISNTYSWNTVKEEIAEAVNKGEYQLGIPTEVGSRTAKADDDAKADDQSSDDAKADDQSSDDAKADDQSSDDAKADSDSSEKSTDEQNLEAEEKIQEKGQGYEVGADGMIPEEDRITADDVSDAEAMVYIYEQNPDAKGIYATNAETMTEAVKIKETLGLNDMVIIGYDMNETIANGILEGDIESTVLQNPFGMGYAAVVAAARAYLELGNEAEIDTGYMIVDQDNIQTAQVQSMMY